MISARSLINEKPWYAAIQSIDGALHDLRPVLEKAFAEGSQSPSMETEPKEWVKLELFRVIWRQAEYLRCDYLELTDIDVGYQYLQDHLHEDVKHFMTSSLVRAVCQRHQISLVISERKIQLLQKIIALHHSLLRTRFMLEKLMRKYSPDECRDAVFAMKTGAEVNARHFSLIDYLYYRERIVDPLKMLNAVLIERLKNKGYGEIKIDHLLTIERLSRASDSVFVPLYSKLNDLPSTAELSQQIKVLGSNQFQIDSASIAREARNIAAIRLVLQHATHTILEESVNQVDRFDEQCLALQDVNLAMQQRCFREMAHFFEDIEGLKACLDHQATDKGSKVSLARVAEEAALDCQQQSSNFFKKCWHTVAVMIREKVEEISGRCLQALASYEVSQRDFDEIREAMHVISKPLQPSFDLISEWREVHQQTHSILQQADRLMGKMQKRAESLSDTNTQHLIKYLKRHWPELTISVVLTTGTSIVLSLTVLAAVTFAPFITIPAMALGVAGGYAAGKVRDKLHPLDPPRHADLENAIEIERQVNPSYIISRLFGTPEHPVIMKEVEPISVTEKRKAESPSVSTWLSDLKLFKQKKASPDAHLPAERLHTVWKI